MTQSLAALVLVYSAGSALTFYVSKGFFDTMPKALDESAQIDGATKFQIFTKITFPLAKPIIVYTSLTAFMSPWMDFIFPKMILRSPEKQTLALGLFGFITDKKNEFTTFAAGALIVAVPFIIMFTLSQKMMVTSFGQAAVKE